MLLFLPVTFLMAAMGFAAHAFLRRSQDAMSSCALGTTVYFALPLIALLVTKVLWAMPDRSFKPAPFCGVA
ncbi:hypothetical protein MUU75_12620 [Pseudoxanthomonas mexicana]|uniref:hypothetical protein n=1 Tax=Pseudoxanthomonas mexicana TaxID=128785 RepID=UPI001FD705CD|nr:hypothetical protein [Pseudoxanthomonas mexicana]UOV03999.1 hypothetical protein MUU75_12620 [Pseudoxanthomonas mexicana]